MKKILLSIIVLLSILILTVLVTPFSLFQKQIFEAINSSSSIRVSTNDSISYNLLNAQELKADNISIELPDYLIDFETVLLRVDIKSLIKKDIVIEELKFKIRSISEKKNLNKKTVNKNKENKAKGIDSITVKNIDIIIDEALLSDYNVNNISIISKIINVKLDELLIEGNIDLSILNKDLEGIISLKNTDFQNIEIDLKLNDLDNLFQQIKLNDIKLHGALELKYKGRIENFSEPLNNVMSLTIEGENLRWVGKDLDEILDAYIDSKKVGLLDVAGYLTLGPIGILVSKGTDLAKAGLKGVVNGETVIDKVFTKVTMNQKVVSLEDVAVATKKHRIVANGKINLNDHRFEDFNIGTVDEKGCSIFAQEISGKLVDPEIGALNSIMNETFSKFKELFKSSISLIVDRCDNQYRGVVK
ncbi:hypothetical protein [Halobacteriovorax sp.]|uniref:hypothetical protein n=1 Tax=Halobacteriovorax sp. TaxID=2020862 RepID=UPI00356A1B44